MELIIEFYKELDTLNLIIFWGIIIVIILLLIFSCILINKNKKLKQMVDKNNLKYEEELPIKKATNPIIENNVLEQIEKTTEIKDENINDQKEEPIEIEKNFVVEEHIMEYQKENHRQETNNNENKYNENNRVINIKSSIELPTAPYQRNVLREMSLSQTSPIGINRQEKPIDKKIEIAKDLEESLKQDKNEMNIEKKIDDSNVTTKIVSTQIKEELKDIENNSSRKTEINNNNKLNDDTKINEKILTTTLHERNNIDITNKNNNKTNEKSSSEKYLEEVSRKLAEAEIPDEIERTDYELQQEEDAIISYKELMDKKDSIQTVDEEDAIISIEELIERNKQKEELNQENSKLYNLTEEEENDNFINELKQFRNDL